MAVPAGPGLLELLLALLRRAVIPVARVDVVVDDLVVERLHRREELPPGVEIRGTHVGRLDAYQVDEGLLDLLHLGADLGGAHAAHSAVGPGWVGC